MNPGVFHRKLGLRGRSPHRRRGFTLLECLVYFAVFFIIASLALLTYYRAEQDNRQLRRNAEDILRTLQAGEQWRQDIRLASGPPRSEGPEAAKELVIPQTNQVVKYVFREGAVWRQAGPKSAVFLPAVARSQMTADKREHVTAWRWEVELQSRQRVVHVRPLFTFEAAAKQKQP
jgi:type II secretory pathway pseudopilin PulG